jgi:hypothetical protein
VAYSFLLGYHVAAKVHPIGEVHVEMPTLPEHHLVAVCLSMIGMAGRICFTEIRFDLYDSSGQDAGAIAAYEIRSQEVPCHLKSWPQIELAWELRDGSISLL